MGNVLIEWNSEKILQAITDDIKLQNLLRKEVFETGLWVQTLEYPNGAGSAHGSA